MATTKILLREDIDNLGGRGDIVNVKSGYARNYLFPRGYALLATKGNIKQIEQERAALLRKAAEEKSTAENQLKQLKEFKFTFERKAGESGTLFGSVTSIDIAEAFASKGYEIDRRKIILKTPIKEIGKYTIPVKLHREVTFNLSVDVVVENESIQERIDSEVKKTKDAESSDVSSDKLEDDV